MRHRVQDLVEVDARADGARGVEEQTELPVLGLGLSQQLRVVDGRRRLLSQGGGQLPLLPREVPLHLGLDEHQEPDRPPLVHQWHVEEALLAVLEHVGAVLLVHLRVRDPLLDDLAAVEDLPVERVLVQGIHTTHPALPVGLRRALLERDHGHGLRVGVVGVDGALGGVQRLARLVGDGREQLVEVDGRRHRPAGTEQRAQPPRLLGFAPEHPRRVHGHRRRHGHELEQPQVVRREAARGALLDQGQRAHHLVLEDEGDGEDAALTPALHDRLVSGRHARIVRLPLAHGALGEEVLVAGSVGDGIDGAEPGAVVLGDLARPQGGGDERIGLTPVLVDVALPDVERLRDPARDGREHLLQAGARRDGPADVGREREGVSAVALPGHIAETVLDRTLSRHARPPCRDRRACPRTGPRRRPR